VQIENRPIRGCGSVESDLLARARSGSRQLLVVVSRDDKTRTDDLETIQGLADTRSSPFESGNGHFTQILLGGEMEFGVDDGDGNARSEDDAVLNLRSLDILALGKFPHDIHLANLSEAYFPSKTQPYGWPFAEKYVVPSDNQRDISVEILRTRSQTAQLGDLYILWLALTGLAPDRELTMSWISKIGNELQNPSSLITLLTQPKVRNDNVIRLAGGVGLSPALRNNPQGAVIPHAGRHAPVPR